MGEEDSSGLAHCPTVSLYYCLTDSLSPALLNRPTAVNRNPRAGDKATGVAGEENSKAANLF